MGTELWILLGAAVLLPRVGLALYLSGVARSKNAAGAILRTVTEACLSILVFWAIGAAVMLHSRGYLFDWHNQFNSTEFFAAAAILIGSGIVVGSTLERSRLAIIAPTSLIMAGLVIPFGWRLAASGALAKMGLIDAAGATYIHWAGGLCAAVGAILIGARTGKHNRDGSSNVLPGHSLPLASAGILLMLVGWIPYVVGMFYFNSAAEPAPSIAINILLAAAAGAIASLIYTRIRYSKVDIYLVYAGLLGGLVAITAGAGVMTTRAAVATGLIAGFIIPFAAVKIDLIWKIDDPSAGISIHAVGGFWGAIAAAIFTAGSMPQHLHRLRAAALALLIIGLISISLSWLALSIMKATLGIRSREADEFDGLDLAEHDLNAYPDFQQTMIKSYHLREA